MMEHSLSDQIETEYEAYLANPHHNTDNMYAKLGEYLKGIIAMTIKEGSYVDEDIAEELTQDVLILVATDKIYSFEKKEARFATYCAVIAKNKALDYVRKRNRYRFVLPNGAEWTQVEANLTDTPVVWGPDGTEYRALQGELRFYCTDGQTYNIYICEESIDPDPYDTSLMYYLNHYSGNTIQLKQSEFQTVDSRFPGGYNVNTASRNCYYIVNGETVEIDVVPR